MPLAVAHTSSHNLQDGLRSRPAKPVASASRVAVRFSGSQLDAATSAAPRGFDLDAFMLEREKRTAQRDAQRQAALDEASAGFGWWQQNAPANMVLVNSHEELQFCIEQAQHQQKLLVVNYFGEQCYACKSLYPKLCQIARDNYDVLFAKVNLTQSDHVRLLLEEQGITTVPFFQLYQFGVVVSKFSASLNPQKLAVLRAEIAANKGSGLAGTDSPVYTTLEA